MTEPWICEQFFHSCEEKELRNALREGERRRRTITERLNLQQREASHHSYRAPPIKRHLAEKVANIFTLFKRAAVSGELFIDGAF